MRLQFCLVLCSFLCCKLHNCHDNLSSDLSSAVFCNMQVGTAMTQE